MRVRYADVQAGAMDHRGDRWTYSCRVLREEGVIDEHPSFRQLDGFAAQISRRSRERA